MNEENNAKYRTRANNMLNVEASIAQMVPLPSSSLTLAFTHSPNHTGTTV